LEAEGYEFSGGINQTKGVWLQIHFISDDFEFYKIRLEQLASHGCSIHCLARSMTACGVGEDLATCLPQQIPKRFTCIL
jgi:hypothetical protein